MDKELEFVIANARKIKKIGWIKSVSNYSSAVGLTLEKAFGKEEDQFELPDYFGVELKTKCFGSRPYVFLFNAAPDSFVLEAKRILNTYGHYDHKHPDCKKFYGYFKKERKKIPFKELYAAIEVDKIEERVCFNIYNSSGEKIDNDTAWSFDLLKEKLCRKFKYLLFAKAEAKSINGITYFRYKYFVLYKLKSFLDFINLIDDGTIGVNFKIDFYKKESRYGHINNHGMSFEIKETDLKKLFTKIYYIR